MGTKAGVIDFYEKCEKHIDCVGTSRHLCSHQDKGEGREGLLLIAARLPCEQRRRLIGLERPLGMEQC